MSCQVTWGALASAVCPWTACRAVWSAVLDCRRAVVRVRSRGSGFLSLPSTFAAECLLLLSALLCRRAFRRVRGCMGTEGFLPRTSFGGGQAEVRASLSGLSRWIPGACPCHCVLGPQLQAPSSWGCCVWRPLLLPMTHL